MRQIVSISVDPQTADIIKRYHLSPTHVFRHAVRMKTMPAAREEEEFKQKVALLSVRLDKILRALEARGMVDDVLAEADGNEKRGVRISDEKNHGIDDNRRNHEIESAINGSGSREVAL